MKNIFYKTDKIKSYFSKHRIRWDQFYKSERVILTNTLTGFDSQSILDIGCGCGGLGLALQEQFNISNYTGIEINTQAAKFAQELNPVAEIICADFLELEPQKLPFGQFDVVISLSCIDWQLNFDSMFKRAWLYVKPGGNFVFSLRLTDGIGVNDINSSYQFINYDGVREGEIAPYVILNAKDLMHMLIALGPSKISGFGFYGPPSSTAVTEYKELCFTVFAVKKPAELSIAVPQLELHLPQEIISLMLNAVQSK